MSEPRVTALINTFNYGRFIGEAIESVLQQDVSAEEMEILVVDDGSTDDTAAQVAKFGSRVRYLRKENGGQASALNVGFAQARGEIIAGLDGDDLWRAGKIRRVLETFEQHSEAGMVYHPYRVWNVARNIQVDDAGFRPISGYVPARLEDALQYGSFGTCAMSLRKPVVARVLPIPEELRIYADTYLLLTMTFAAPVAAVSEPYTIYRHHGGNSTAFGEGSAERRRQRWLCYQSGVEAARKWLERNGYDVRNANASAYLRRHELTAEMFRFQAQGASRAEFFAHLREETRLYAPLWSRRYRMYRALLACGAFALGYRGFLAAQASYRQQTLLRASRQRLIPHSDTQPQPGAVHSR